MHCRRVQLSVQPSPLHTVCIFIDRQSQHRVGPILRFRTDEKVMELLRRAHANLETCNWVERAMVEHRPCMIDVDLTEEQYEKLQRPKPRHS